MSSPNTNSDDARDHRRGADMQGPPLMEGLQAVDGEARSRQHRRNELCEVGDTAVVGRPYVPRHAYAQAARTFPDVSEKGPLIDRVTNRWEEDAKKDDVWVDEKEVDTFEFWGDSEDEDECPSSTRRWSRRSSRRFRRTLICLTVVLVGVLYGFAICIPQLKEQWEFKEGFLPQRVDGTYGIAQGGDFEGVRLKELEPEYIPGGIADPKGKKRLIFVGDIHGCLHELQKLLKKVDFNEENDHLIATGDVVSKGPHNIKVLDELIRLKATSVRGNHEDSLLEQAKTVLAEDYEESSSDLITTQGAKKDARLLKKMTKKHLQYLRDMPLMLRVPGFPSVSSSLFKKANGIIKHDIVVVHAGLVPHVPLDRQDPYYVMNMRAINKHTHLPSDERGGKAEQPWFPIWNWYNGRLADGRPVDQFFNLDYEGKDIEHEQPVKRLSVWWNGGIAAMAKEKQKHKQPQVVVYGHDSKMGLQIKKWSKGLDTACVSGGRLTAMVVDASGKPEMSSVGCKNYRS